MKKEIVYKKLDELKPYKRNPRKINRDAIDAVAASIKKYGFRGAIQITADGTIINGHTRLKAAQKIGLKELPCEVVSDLDEESVREYRLIDNKSAEYSQWEKGLLSGELADLDLSELDFHFEFGGDLRQRDAWKATEKKCNLKQIMRSYRTEGVQAICFYRTGKAGVPLEEIKRPEYVDMFIENLVDYVDMALGENVADGGWCLLTTPRRRHADDFHFSTAICRGAAQALRLPFYEDAIAALDRDRIRPRFSLEVVPAEKNVILYDDVITTGNTIRASRDLLVDKGCVVYPVVAISNR